MSEPVATKNDKKPRKLSPMRKTRPVVKKKEAVMLAAVMPPLTRYQKYVETPGSRVAYADLTPEPFNSLVRSIDPVSRQKLLDEVRRGLVNRPVYNRQTGQIVGGHQRLDVLGELEGICPVCLAHESKLSPLWRAIRAGKPHSLDSWLDPAADTTNPASCTTCKGSGFKAFSVDVDIIDVPLVDEKRISVVLNNGALQGSYNGDGLSQILADMATNNITYSDAGFDPVDLEMLQVDPKTYLLSEEDPEAVRPIVEDATQVDAMKALRKEHKTSERDAGQAQADKVVLIQFESPEDRARLLARLAIRPDDPMGGIIKGWRLLEALGIQRPAPPTGPSIPSA